MRRRVLSGWSACVVAACWVALPSAPAQDALGGGNALDRDLTMKQRHGQHAGALDANSQVGSNRINATAPRTDFYSRNLIVTGDVAGGRGFRGSVGYLEQSEFMGKTGADDNRQWDAYAALSTPQAIQSGLDPFKATQQYGAVLYSRSYSDAAARDILTNQQPLDARLAFDRFTADAMRMARQADLIDAANTRDTAARQNWRQEGKQPGVGASSGVGAAGNAQSGVPVDALLSGMGLTAYERQQLKQDVLSGRTNRAWLGQVWNERMLAADASQADAARLTPTVAAEYNTLLDTMRARAGMAPRAPGDPADIGVLRPDGGQSAGTGPRRNADGTVAPGTDPNGATQPGSQPGALPVNQPGALPSGVQPLPTTQQPENSANSAERRRQELQEQLDAQLERLRDELAYSGPDARRAAPRKDRLGVSQSGQGTAKGGASPANPSGTNPSGARSGQPGSEVRADDEADRKVDLDAMALVLRHGQHMQSLVPEDAGYIKDMMQLAEESMRTGDFFRAEQRFQSVLAVIPGHPLALAGVTNSQVGAGLSISAALSLRKLFTLHPEMIDTRFGPEVLPSPERLEDGLATARTRLRAAMSPQAGPVLAADRFDYGLLIAYIGFQQGRPEVIEEGLGAMRACREDDPMVRLLQGVWLGKDAPAAPAAAPAAEPAPVAQPAAQPASETPATQPAP